MICPQCKSEFVEGIYCCSDCGTTLVDFLLKDTQEFINPPQSVNLCGKKRISCMKRIAVFCGSSIGNEEEYLIAAQNLGSALVKNGLGLVFGMDRKRS